MVFSSLPPPPPSPDSASSGSRERSPVRWPSLAPPRECSASLELLSVTHALAPVRHLSPSASAAAASNDEGARSRRARYHVRRQRDTLRLHPCGSFRCPRAYPRHATPAPVLAVAPGFGLGAVPDSPASAPLPAPALASLATAAASDAADPDVTVRPARISHCTVTWLRPGDPPAVPNTLALSVFHGFSLCGD